MNVANRIVDQELEALGVVGRKQEEKVRPRQASIFDDDYVVAPRARRTEIVTERHNKWNKDSVCERLEQIAKAWSVEAGHAVMPGREFDTLVTTIATDLANMMEHAGLVYRGASSPALLADVVSDFITTQMNVRIGCDYHPVGCE